MAEPEDAQDRAENETDVPGLSTWPRVYAFVVAAFLLWVALLTALMRTYS